MHSVVQTNNKVIIFEGLDRVGKTSQIKLLLKYLLDNPTYVIHFSGIPGIEPATSRKYSEIMYDDMFNLIRDANDNNRNLIFDRSHLGEYVYSPIYRKYSGEFIFDIEKKHVDVIKNVHLFVLIDTPANLLEREDGNSFTLDINKKQHEIDLFKEAFDKTNIRHKYLIDINKQSINTVHTFIRNILFGY